MKIGSHSEARPIEPRDRIIAPCTTRDPFTGEMTGVDPSGLLLRLLLFEGNVLDSLYLREVPHLVDQIGLDATTRLFTEAGLTIKCDARTPGENGRSARFPGRHRTAPLPLGTYCFNLGWEIPPQEFFDDAMVSAVGKLDEMGVRPEGITRLAEAVERQFQPLSGDFGQLALAQLERDLVGDQPKLYLRSLRHAVAGIFGSAFAEEAELSMSVQMVGDGAFRAETNLGKFGLTSEQQHDIVRDALFGIAGVNFRIQEMEQLGAISGFQPDELPLFDEKLDHIARHALPEPHAGVFHSIVEVSGLPDIETAFRAGEQVDVDRLMAVRDTPECRDFRRWLRTLSPSTAGESSERVRSLRSRIAGATRSKTARSIRFGTVVGAGVVPGIGLPLGAGLGFLDGFVLDRLIGDPGPAAFLSRQYKSVFK